MEHFKDTLVQHSIKEAALLTNVRQLVRQQCMESQPAAVKPKSKEAAGQPSSALQLSEHAATPAAETAQEGKGGLGSAEEPPVGDTDTAMQLVTTDPVDPADVDGVNFATRQAAELSVGVVFLLRWLRLHAKVKLC